MKICTECQLVNAYFSFSSKLFRVLFFELSPPFPMCLQHFIYQGLRPSKSHAFFLPDLQKYYYKKTLKTNIRLENTPKDIKYWKETSKYHWIHS